MPDVLAEKARAVAKELRDRGASLKQIEDAVARVMSSTPNTNLPKMPKMVVDATRVTPGKGDFAATLPGIRGILTSAPQAIPGVERLQAGIRSVVRNQPYSEALSDMRTETDPVPLPIKLAAQAPAIIASGKLPLSPAKAGALFGGASQALSADQMSGNERAIRTGLGAVTGGATGKALDVGTTFVRSRLPGSKTPGEVAGSLKDVQKATSKRNYDAAYAEGAEALKGGSNAKIRYILERPDIKYFSDQVRASRKFANADDARVLGETYKLIGKQLRGLKQRMSVNGYDAQAALDADNLGFLKDDLLNAADEIMPSFRNAVNAHREIASEIGAVGTGVDAARRVTGVTPSGKRLTTQSKEAYAKEIKGMTPKNRAAATKAIFGTLKDRTGFQPNVVSAGGLLTSIQRPAQVSSFLRDAGEEGQSFTDGILRQLLFAGSTQAP